MLATQNSKQTNNVMLTERYKNTVIIMCITTICAVVFGMYCNSDYNFDIKQCIYSLAYVFSFDFLIMFYLEINKEKIFKARLSPFLIALVPAICIFFVHFGNKLVSGVILIFCITLLSGLINFTVSGITLFMIFVYSVFCGPYAADLGIEVVLFAFCLCLFARHVTSLKTLFYSCLICCVFYVIVGIFTFDFSIAELFGTQNVVFLLIGIATLIIVSALSMYVYKYTLMRNKSLYFTLPDDENEDTDIESDKKFLLPDRITNKLVDATVPDDVVSKEEYDKLEERIQRLYAENEELYKKVNSVNGKKAFVYSDICSEDSPFVIKLKNDIPNIYEHSMMLARFSREAAKTINCDDDMAYLLGVFHESNRFLGSSYQSILRSSYLVPDYVLKSICVFSEKTVKRPIIRELAINLLINDMIHTYTYVVKNPSKFADVDTDDIAIWNVVVRNTIKVRNEQNMLRLAGFSSEELNILKQYFLSIGGKVVDSVVRE